MDVSSAKVKCKIMNHGEPITALCLSNHCRLRSPVCIICISMEHSMHAQKCVPLDQVDKIRQQIHQYTTNIVIQGFQKLKETILSHLNEIEQCITSMGNTSSDLLDQQWTINTLDLLAKAIRATKYGNEPAEKWQKLLEEQTIEISTCLTNLLDTLHLGIASPKTSYKHKMSLIPQETKKFILKTNDHSHIQLIGDVKARNLNNFSFGSVTLDPPIIEGVSVIKLKLNYINLLNITIGMASENKWTQILQLSSDGLITLNSLAKQKTSCSFRTGDVLQFTFDTDLQTICILNQTTNKRTMLDNLQKGQWYFKVVMTNSEIELINQ